MNKTKQKILSKSRELFNNNGLINTTLRQISQAIDISQGNLNYHFRTKDDLIEALYAELVEKIDHEMQSMVQYHSLISMLYMSAEKSMRIFYEYRFLLRDLYLIFRENEKIRNHFIKLQVRRKQQFAFLFKGMEEQCLIRSEDFKEEYERLYERMGILGDNWINAFELMNNDYEDPVRYYQDLLFEIIYPYLTDEGKNQYYEILENCDNMETN